jgi:hypothetical protein
MHVREHSLGQDGPPPARSAGRRALRSAGTANAGIANAGTAIASTFNAATSGAKSAGLPRSPVRSAASLVLCTWIAAACFSSACAEPPSKEMAQAQGAIDAARAVGAERYAAQEFSAATTALAQSNEAVTQRDYRLALNHALESREHAQNAAREAADARARIRGEVERSMAEITALLAQANNAVSDAEAARAPRTAVRDARQVLAQVHSAVQKAGAAMKADDYLAAEPLLEGVKDQVEKAIANLEEARPGRRRRSPGGGRS